MGKIEPINKKKFIEQSEIFIDKYSSFNNIHEDGIPSLVGNIYLNDENNQLIDYYKIQIKFTENFPKRFPLVFELTKKIPENIDWHIFENDGNCCLSSFPEELIYCNNDYTLINFFEDKVIPFFYAQIFRNKNGYFLKERPHGEMGWISFFFDELNTKDLRVVEKSLKFILQNIQLERTASCFCGSKEKYRKCHRDRLENIQKLNNEQLIYFYKKINSFL